jgi:hypothetical protein
MTQRLAGVDSIAEITPYAPFVHEALNLHEMLPVLVGGAESYDGGNAQVKDVRGGFFLGRVTATGKFRPCPRTRVNDSADTAAAFVVDDADSFKAGDEITVGDDTALTISSIDYTTNTITVGSSITFADNEPVFCEDGSAAPRGVLRNDLLRLQNVDRTANVDNQGDMIVRGLLKYSSLKGDVAAILEDISADEYEVIKGLYIDDVLTGDIAINAPTPLQTFYYTLADLAADADLSETVIFAAGQAVTIESIYIVPIAASTGVDASNTSAWTVKKGIAGTTLVTQTYDGTPAFPAAGAEARLGDLAAAAKNLALGDVLTLTVTNGTTADLDATLVIINFRPQ